MYPARSLCVTVRIYVAGNLHLSKPLREVSHMSVPGGVGACFDRFVAMLAAACRLVAYVIAHMEGSTRGVGCGS